MSLLPTKRALEIWVLGAWYDGAARTLPQRCFTAMMTPLVGWWRGWRKGGVEHVRPARLYCRRSS